MMQAHGQGGAGAALEVNVAHLATDIAGRAADRLDQGGGGGRADVVEMQAAGAETGEVEIEPAGKGGVEIRNLTIGIDRDEAGRSMVEIVDRVLELGEVLSDLSLMLKRVVADKVTLDVRQGRDLWPVKADLGQLEQVIVNLAVNARDAMPDGGKLAVRTRNVTREDCASYGQDALPADDYVLLEVEDSGTGIPQEYLDKIFEPFFTTKEVGKGTGLGLSTVYGIVKQSGGFIFADSKVGEGARFVIYLPVHREEVGARRSARAAKPKESELWGTGTILLVEDEPMVRGVAERALTRHGYRVITADNGEGALEVLAAGEEIDLLISDVVMPGMDGPTMVAEARKDRPDLKILFMSGYAEEQLRKSINLDQMSFLPKPFSVQELAEATKRVLGPK
jgi:two-component system cell cycle sensor histidine kinase/response regulator CckA